MFDGKGFSVKNAILYAENNYFGLFSYIGKNGVVKNLNIDSTNRLTAHNNVRKIAALAGINLGTIENCTNSADFGFTASNVTYLAGIVGENYGIVTGCVNNSNMISAGNSKSGIVGENYGTVRKSENNGYLSNSGNVGGITIENRNGKGQALLFIDDYADLSVNLLDKSVKRAGRDIKLSPKEYNLLVYMIENAEKVVSRMDIADKVWNTHFDTGTNFIDVYINYLRKKIDRDFDTKLIHTKTGMGFILTDKL